MSDEPQGEFAAIREAVRRGDFRLTVHATEEMTADRISVDDFVTAVSGADATIVEDYPGDARGGSCLIAGRVESGEFVHFVVSYTPRPTVITAYRLDNSKWIDHRTRRKP